MQLLVSSKPSTAPHRHLKYIPLPPTPTFKAPHDQAPATLPCLFCSISKLAIFLFLEQPHFHLPLPGMLFPQICTWLAPWIEIQEHCSVQMSFPLKEDSFDHLVERALPHPCYSLLLSCFSLQQLLLPDTVFSPYTIRPQKAGAQNSDVHIYQYLLENSGDGREELLIAW